MVAPQRKILCLYGILRCRRKAIRISDHRAILRIVERIFFRRNELDIRPVRSTACHAPIIGIHLVTRNRYIVIPRDGISPDEAMETHVVPGGCNNLADARAILSFLRHGLTGTNIYTDSVSEITVHEIKSDTIRNLHHAAVDAKIQSVDINLGASVNRNAARTERAFRGTCQNRLSILCKIIAADLKGRKHQVADVEHRRSAHMNAVRVDEDQRSMRLLNQPEPRIIRLRLGDLAEDLRDL